MGWLRDEAKTMRDQEFNLWKGRLNRLVEGRYHLDLDSFPDMPFRKWFDSGETPSQALKHVTRAINNYTW